MDLGLEYQQQKFLEPGGAKFEHSCTVVELWTQVGFFGGGTIFGWSLLSYSSILFQLHLQSYKYSLYVE